MQGAIQSLCKRVCLLSILYGGVRETWIVKGVKVEKPIKSFFTGLFSWEMKIAFVLGAATDTWKILQNHDVGECSLCVLSWGMFVTLVYCEDPLNALTSRWLLFYPLLKFVSLATMMPPNQSFEEEGGGGVLGGIHRALRWGEVGLEFLKTKKMND